MNNHPGHHAAGQASAPLEFDVRHFGAVGDGRTLDTAAINRAIDAAHAAGGGTVIFPAGDYLSYSIRLQSRVTLWVQLGTTVIAAEPPAPGKPGGYDVPEEAPPNIHQDFGHSRFRNSLFWGENIEHVTIKGPGRIYGRGLSRGNGRIALPVGEVAPQPPGHLPDVLEADGPVEPFGGDFEKGAFGYPNAVDTLPAGVGNKAIALRTCRDVSVRDLTILHGGHFALLASDCNHVTIDNLVIDTNRDGIDIDACSNVQISNCSVNSPWDDGICLKSSCGFGGLRTVENVTVSNCYVSGFEEGTLLNGTRSRVIRHRGGPIGRIKLGTEASGGFRNIIIRDCIFEFCRGLALEQVDGSMMDDIVVTNLMMKEVMNSPIFVRLGGRLRAPGTDEPGSASRITISQVKAFDVAPEHGVFIAGLPGYPVNDLKLSDIELHFRGGGTEADALRSVPEMVRDYPEPMLFGTLPSWGLYVRHATGLCLRNVSLNLMQPDARPAVILDDVAGVDLSDVHLSPESSRTEWILNNVSDVVANECDGLGATTLG